jgi:hypothetical protein
MYSLERVLTRRSLDWLSEADCMSPQVAVDFEEPHHHVLSCDKNGVLQIWKLHTRAPDFDQDVASFTKPTQLELGHRVSPISET